MAINNDYDVIESGAAGSTKKIYFIGDTYQPLVPTDRSIVWDTVGSVKIRDADLTFGQLYNMSDPSLTFTINNGDILVADLYDSIGKNLGNDVPIKESWQDPEKGNVAVDYSDDTFTNGQGGVLKDGYTWTVAIIGGDESIEQGQTWTDSGATLTGTPTSEAAAAGKSTIIETFYLAGGRIPDTNTAKTYDLYYAPDSFSTVPQSIQDMIAGYNPHDNRELVIYAGDNTKPVITLANPLTVNLSIGDTYVEPGYTATDDVDGNITGSVVITGLPVNTSVAGTSYIEYNVTDSSGNIAITQIRTVIIAAAVNQPPSIYLNGSANMTSQIDQVFVDPGATASDPEDGDITGNITVGGSVNVSTAGNYTLTYSVTDSSGESVSVTRNVEIIDTSDKTKPVITLVAPTSMTIQLGSAYIEPGYSAQDDIDGEVAVTVTGNINTNLASTQYLYYDAEDSSGNQAIQKKRTVNVVKATDNTPPVITVAGTNPVNIDQGSSYIDAGATAVDSTDGTVPVSTSGNVDTSIVGTYTITYTASDSSGNSTTASRIVNVGTVAPTYNIGLNGDSGYEVLLDSAWVDQGATVYSNGAAGLITYAGAVAYGGIDTSKLGKQSIFYSDPQNNTADIVERVIYVVEVFSTTCMIDCELSSAVATPAECSTNTIVPVPVSGSCGLSILDGLELEDTPAQAFCDTSDIDIPVFDSKDSIDVPDLKDVTEEVVSGGGVFDSYMRAGSNQLTTQYDKGRIKGAEYAQAYIAMMQLMMTEANKFVLGVFQAEIAAKMFEVQYLGAEYDAALKKEQAEKLRNDSQLICQQIAELSANGVEERKLKGAQTLKTVADKDLTCQQTVEAKESGAVERAVKIESTKKINSEVALICQQEAELKANGAKERELKMSQKQTQVKQSELYKQQITSFKEKTNIDAAKLLYDAWSVNAVEEPDALVWAITELKNDKTNTNGLPPMTKHIMDLAKKKV